MSAEPGTRRQAGSGTAAERRSLLVHGRVRESLPHALYRTELDSGDLVLTHLAESLRTHLQRVLPGDRVAVELSSLDWGRGRIIEKLKS